MTTLNDVLDAAVNSINRNIADLAREIGLTLTDQKDTIVDCTDVRVLDVTSVEVICIENTNIDDRGDV